VSRAWWLGLIWGVCVLFFCLLLSGCAGSPARPAASGDKWLLPVPESGQPICAEGLCVILQGDLLDLLNELLQRRADGSAKQRV
jgi:hypothetical protein